MPSHANLLSLPPPTPLWSATHGRALESECAVFINGSYNILVGSVGGTTRGGLLSPSLSLPVSVFCCMRVASPEKRTTMFPPSRPSRIGGREKLHACTRAR